MKLTYKLGDLCERLLYPLLSPLIPKCKERIEKRKFFDRLYENVVSSKSPHTFITSLKLLEEEYVMKAEELKYRESSRLMDLYEIITSQARQMRKYCDRKITDLFKSSASLFEEISKKSVVDDFKSEARHLSETWKEASKKFEKFY